MISKDYFDIRILIKRPMVIKLIAENDHIIISASGQIISERGKINIKNQSPLKIQNKNNVFGVLYLPFGENNNENEQSSPLYKAIQEALQDVLEEYSYKNRLVIDEMIYRNTDYIIELGREESISIEKVCQLYLLQMQGLLPFEAGDVFILQQGKLQLVSGINSDESYQNIWSKDDFQSLPYLTVFNHRAYFSNCCNISKVKNWLTFPIIYGPDCLGIICFYNHYLPRYSQEIINTLTKSTTSLAHIMYQKITQHRVKDNQNLSKKLRPYISENIYKELDNQHGLTINQSAKKAYIVPLYADIRSFTKISESLDPSVLVSLLNYYFEVLASVCISYGGTIEKFAGDMIACLFNVPKEIDQPELAAFNCALKMQQAMVTKVVPKFVAAGVKYVGIGIGLDCGHDYVGHLGSRRFNLYTALGKTTQYAITLESKALPGEVWISKNMYSKIKTLGVPPFDRRISQTLANGSKREIYIYKKVNYPNYVELF